MSIRRGTFISFEGGDRSGKSTQLGLLADALRRAQYRVTETAEPGGTPLGRHIRRLLLSTPRGLPAPVPWAECALFLASRAQLVEQVVVPALARGAVVLCDRFSDSTLAYQGFGRGLDRAAITRWNRAVTGGVRPDLTLLLDVDPREGRRRGGRAGVPRADRMEREAAAFHARVRGGFLALARRDPARIRVIPQGSVAEVQRRIQEVVWTFLNRRAA